MSSTDSTKFLGLTKTQAIVVLLVLWAICAGLLGFAVVKVVELSDQTARVARQAAGDAGRIEALARQGAKAHHGLCAFRSQLRGEVTSNMRYLALSPEQRAAKYGVALANVPRATILHGIKTERATIKALDPTGCS